MPKSPNMAGLTTKQPRSMSKRIGQMMSKKVMPSGRDKSRRRKEKRSTHQRKLSRRLKRVRIGSNIEKRTMLTSRESLSEKEDKEDKAIRKAAKATNISLKANKRTTIREEIPTKPEIMTGDEVIMIQK